MIISSSNLFCNEYFQFFKQKIFKIYLKTLQVNRMRETGYQYKVDDSITLEEWIIFHAFLKGTAIKLQCQQNWNASEFKKIWNRGGKIALKKKKKEKGKAAQSHK